MSTSRTTRRVVRAAVSRSAIGLVLAAFLFQPTAGPAAAAGPACSAETGQALIDDGRLERAVREFSCVIDDAPTSADGYRGRAEALLLLGRFSDAFDDYNAGITALVLPVDPDAATDIVGGYTARLKADPASVPALTGLSFARWVFFDYAQAIQRLDQLLTLRPDDVYGTLFRGSSRLLLGATKAQGKADLERAVALAPTSPDVRFIVADAYTYGSPDPERALAEATRAFEWGLDTPRVHAVLGAALTALGDPAAAAAHIHRHIELVTTDLVVAPALAAGDSLTVALVPGRTYAIPVHAVAGDVLEITTGSRDMWDTIAVILGPDGSPVIGSDDDSAYFAAFDWPVPTPGDYTLLVTSFESVATGDLDVDRS